eukprot:1011589-Lingulodinium_polyedra.AAC.1
MAQRSLYQEPPPDPMRLLLAHKQKSEGTGEPRLQNGYVRGSRSLSTLRQTVASKCSSSSCANVRDKTRRP